MPRSFDSLEDYTDELFELREKIWQLRRRLEAVPIEAYIPHPKQLLAHQDLRPYIVVSGGNRAGKTQYLAGEGTWHVQGNHPYKGHRIPLPPYDIYLGTGATLEKFKTESKLLVAHLLANFPKLHPMGEPLIRENALIWETLHGKIIGHLKSHHQDVLEWASGEPILTLIDEPVKEEYFEEAQARRISRGGQLIIGATSKPIEKGETTYFYDRFIRERDVYRNDDQDVGIYIISTYDNPYIDHEQVKVEERQMSPAVARVRIYGDPTPMAQRPAFDPQHLAMIWQRRLDSSVVALPHSVYFDPTLDKPEMRPDDDGSLFIFRPPQPGHEYVLAGDTSRGGRHDDWGVWQVFDAMTYEQAATYRAHIDVEAFTAVGAALGITYNLALVAVELAREGYAVLSDLRLRYQYPAERLFRGMKAVQGETRPEANIGWLPTAQNKAAAYQALIGMTKPLADNVPGTLRIYHYETYREMCLIERGLNNKGGTYSAPVGFHDDCADALAIAAQIAKSGALDWYGQSGYELAQAIAQRQAEATPRWIKLLANEGAVHPYLGGTF